MIIEGERIKALISAAKTEVILCSPFVKARVLGILLDAIPEGVSVTIVTRWRPAEVAAGLSDLEVFDIANERSRTEVRLSHALHAKLYVADDGCLVGSANLTAAALGWRQDTNLEILIPAKRTDADVAFLLARLKFATPATFQIRAEVESLAAALDGPALDEAKDVLRESVAQASAAWLPRCAAPDKLYDVYQDPDTTVVAEDTRIDARADLDDLLLPSGLTGVQFTSYVAEALSRIPSFRTFLNSVPAGLTDVQGEQIVSGLRADLEEADARNHWRIVRQWIAVFFQDAFEVAPQSYIVRLKPR